MDQGRAKGLGRCFICTELQGLDCVGTLLWPAQCKEVSEVTHPGVVTSVPSPHRSVHAFFNPGFGDLGNAKHSPEGSALPSTGPVLRALPDPGLGQCWGPIPWSVLGHYWTSTVPVLGQCWATTGGLYPAQSLATTEAPALTSTGPLLRALPCPALGHY